MCHRDLNLVSKRLITLSFTGRPEAASLTCAIRDSQKVVGAAMKLFEEHPSNNDKAYSLHISGPRPPPRLTMTGALESVIERIHMLSSTKAHILMFLRQAFSTDLLSSTKADSLMFLQQAFYLVERLLLG